MPPKKAAAAPDKAKQKTVEDKTFGLKNKNKSAKVQKYVQQLQKSAQPQRNPRLEEPSRKDKKRAEEERAKELADLFALTIKQPKVPLGVDPKSIVCEYFRHGQCTKGFKCKFSHDLSVERKTQKADIYTDRRGGEEGEGEGGMEDWDQEQLEKAIAQKHGVENKNRPTEIVCKFFLEAVEKRLYGWFWQCPNGKECKYRHGLPPGYVLKSQMKELLEAEAANKVSVEEEIEEERSKVEAKTPITVETFAQWMREKEAAKRAKAEAAEVERKKKGRMTGREIFLEEGFVAQDDLGASDAIVRENDEEAAIKRMEREAQEAMRIARAASAEQAAPASAEAGGGSAQPAAASQQQANGGGEGAGAKLQLSAQEAEELFGDDDDDDDDELLDELEQDLQSKAAI